MWRRPLVAAHRRLMHSPMLKSMYTVARIEDLTCGGTHFAAVAEVAGMTAAENRPVCSV